MTSMLNQPMDILNFGICGYHQYCLQEPVHLTFSSENLCRMLDAEQKELVSPASDLYMNYIHPNDRASYREVLHQVMASPCTKTIQYRLMPKNREPIYVSDTITSQNLEDGTLVGNSVLTELKYPQKTNAYLDALKDVYDKIFRYDFGRNTVTCIHCREHSRFQWVQNIPMAMETATEKWITDTVVGEDRGKLQSYFRDYCEHGRFQAQKRPAPITYSAVNHSGLVCQYRGLFLELDSSTYLYCCRCMSEEERSAKQKQEKVEHLLRSFTEGIAAFEVTNGFVTPLYASDNVCRFFGFTKGEWSSLMEKKTSIPEFVSHCEVDLETFQELLAEGKGEFSYLDLETNTKRQMKAVCSAPTSDGTRFVMLYHAEPAPPSQTPPVFIRTFGYFDVFIGEDPIPFRNQKSKELLALLVDRKGGYLSSQEAIGFLWEDEDVNAVTLARYRKVALRLKNTLQAYGIGDIMECVDGKRRIIPTKVRCDLYEYLSDTDTFGNTFKGSYLTNYSWGEYTLAELTGNIVSL